MKAIPTLYDGTKFRSKLEAQWAKLLDHYGIPWAYESEGYEFEDGTRYLPDFWLPDSKQWMEVKGIMNDKDMHKCMMLAKESGHDVVIGYPNGRCTFIEYDPEGKDLFFGDEDTQCRIDKCSECGKLFFHGEGSYYCRCCGAYDGDHYLSPPGPSYPECDWGEFAAIDVMAKARDDRDVDQGTRPTKFPRVLDWAEVEIGSFMWDVRKYSAALHGILDRAAAILYCKDCNSLTVVIPDDQKFALRKLNEPHVRGVLSGILLNAFGHPVLFNAISEFEAVTTQAHETGGHHDR